MGGFDLARLSRPGVRPVNIPLPSRKADQAGIAARIKAICETRVRYGYRRVHVLLRREGWDINIKKTHRIYNELGVQLRNKTPKRRVKAKLREDGRQPRGRTMSGL